MKNLVNLLMVRGGTYIHFPFCKVKCMYCDFYSVADRESDITRFTQALIKEIQLCEVDSSKWIIDTVFFGGGTPSLQSPQQLELVLSALHKKFDLTQVDEWSLEVNPGESPIEKLKAFKHLGMNRLSIGIQSLEPSLLTFLTRIHDTDQALATFEHARTAGFDSINCDLIFNIPGQTTDIWQRDLKRIVELEPEHISAYSLTVEPGTILNKLVQQNKVTIPNDDYSAELYSWTQEYLSQAGYIQYEISNWAKPGKECRQNLHYWQIDPYLAFGPSAHGFDGKNRFNNIRSLDKYLQFLESDKLPIENHYPVSEKEMTNDLIGFGLRTNRGVQINRIPSEYRIQIPEKWSSYLSVEDGRLKISEDGFIFADAIVIDLMV